MNTRVCGKHVDDQVRSFCCPKALEDLYELMEKGSIPKLSSKEVAYIKQHCFDDENLLCSDEFPARAANNKSQSTVSWLWRQ